MLFNSFPFVLLCLITFIIYYIPSMRRLQVLVLIVASLIFYGSSSPALLILLVFSILVNTGASFLVAQRPRNEQVAWAALGVVVNLAVLGFFKYGGLLTNLFLHALHAPKNSVALTLLALPLPIGISFYTFEGISLLVDVLRMKRAEADGLPEANAEAAVRLETPAFGLHLYRTSLFIAFFPHLVAGPILKAKAFYPQIQPKYFRDIPWPTVFRAVVLGYFLKMVIADNLANYTFWIAYPYYQAFSGITNAVLLFGYSMQIFADFAGYTSIAIGVASAFGYILPPNFNRPYSARSISDFWRRWHISLSTWLRDYLYFPLGGNRRGHARTYANLLTVMVLGGLWHGAAWKFAIWGAYHGLGLAIERFVGTRKAPHREPPPEGAQGFSLREAFQILGVFIFVSIGWLFFKLASVHQALEYLGTFRHLNSPAPDPILILATLAYSVPVVAYHFLSLSTLSRWRAGLRPPSARAWRRFEAVAYGLMLALLFVNRGSSNAFIYFQF